MFQTEATPGRDALENFGPPDIIIDEAWRIETAARLYRKAQTERARVERLEVAGYHRNLVAGICAGAGAAIGAIVLVFH